MKYAVTILFLFYSLPCLIIFCVRTIYKRFNDLHIEKKYTKGALRFVNLSQHSQRLLLSIPFFYSIPCFNRFCVRTVYKRFNSLYIEKKHTKGALRFVNL